jgi:hypothetical protein
MKTAILAVLLLLAVASIVSSDTPVTSIVSGDAPDAPIVSGDKTESGKSRYGDEKCLPVHFQRFNFIILSLYFITSYAKTYGEMQLKFQAFWCLQYGQKCR